MVDSESDDLVKVVFDLNSGELPDAVETVWADSKGENQYVIRNVPMFANGVSEQDTVFAAETNGRLHVSGVAFRGRALNIPNLAGGSGQRGRRTLRGKLASTGRTRVHLREGNDRLIGIDVPTAADIYAVYAALQDGEDRGLWTFEEGHCGHPLHKS